MTVVVSVVDERPAQALVDAADEHDAMVIVVGTWTESPLRGALLGSVAHKLLQLSTRPVLCVPAGPDVDPDYEISAEHRSGHGERPDPTSGSVPETQPVGAIGCAAVRPVTLGLQMGTNWQRHLNQSLMRIPRRAENTDRYTLATTYVSAGSFSAMLNSTDHQVLYGRRGTGKTHALQYLSDVIERAGDLSIYLDLRTIGSTGGTYADGAASTELRGTHLLVDVLETIHDELLAVAIDGADELLGPLDALAEAATTVEVVGAVERETTVAGTAETRLGFEVSGTPSAPVDRRPEHVHVGAEHVAADRRRTSSRRVRAAGPGAARHRWRAAPAPTVAAARRVEQRARWICSHCWPICCAAVSCPRPGSR